MSLYTCPVCGYGMEDAPADYNICPSCGTEFGNHDVNASLGSLRAVWLRGGAKWWSSVDKPPPGWDPYEQLNTLVRPAPASPSSIDLGGLLQSMVAGKKNGSDDAVEAFLGNLQTNELEREGPKNNLAQHAPSQRQSPAGVTPLGPSRLSNAA
jgi:hypothetical protein